MRMLIAMAAALALLGCFEGSETGNPSKGLTGMIKTLDGVPAARTRVYLVPRDFNPLDLVAGRAFPAADTTDAAGRFRITGIDTGIYNLEALDLVSGTRAMVKGIAVTQGVAELPDQTLRYPGRITAALEGASDTADGYIYVTGTTLYKKVPSRNGTISLDSVAVGEVDSLQYGNTGHTFAPVTFAWGLQVAAEAATPAPAPYLAWTHTRTLSLNTTASGSGISGNVARFPLLVRLSPSLLDFSSVRSGGADLRFTDEAGKPLPCEIQHWDAPAAAAEAWVLVDTVYGNSRGKLRMYWGGPANAAASPAGSVFTLADGYAGAWHLDEDPTGAAPQWRDASGRNNPGTAFGYSAQVGSDTGVVEAGMESDGRTQFASARQAFDNPQVFTVSLWFRSVSAKGGKLLDFTDADTSTATLYRDRHIFMTPNGTLHFSVYPPLAANQTDPNPGVYKTIDSPKPLNDGQWHQVAARLSQAGQTLFVDGVLVASDPASTVAENITGFWRWGYGSLDNWAPPGTSRYFQGALDEIWIAHSARSDDFLKLSFENQRTDSRLLQLP
ncbi:MAG: repeat-containing protein [Fibrobacteres bacterium]|nr:repeat-containing protein [Fibrobacterota bacterium]